MNTMHVDGVDYELIPHGQGCTDVPSVVCNGKAYIGQAIPAFYSKLNPDGSFQITDPTNYGPKWLMQTDDGFNIYENDMVWYIDTHFHIMYAPATLITPVRKDYKYFSTQELAKEWVLMNKPCLSANDIKGWLERYFDYPNGINAYDLIKLVEEKIHATS